MSEHRRLSNVEHHGLRPNPVPYVPVEEKVLCIVCKNPSAVFKMEGKTRYRLAKTMIRLTGPSAPEKLYAHDTPCLSILVRDWAKYIVEERKKGIKTLGVES